MTGINAGHFVIHVSPSSLFNSINNLKSSLPWKNLFIQHFSLYINKKNSTKEEIYKGENISKHLKLILRCQTDLQIPPYLLSLLSV